MQWYQETVLDNGIVVIDEVFRENNGRSTEDTYTRKRTFTDDGVTIAVIKLTATFRYDGSAVSVVSASVTQADTYEGWSYVRSSLTTSGGTVTLDAKLTKLLVLEIPFTMTITCDKNGNISYS